MSRLGQASGAVVLALLAWTLLTLVAEVIVPVWRETAQTAVRVGVAAFLAGMSAWSYVLDWVGLCLRYLRSSSVKLLRVCEPCPNSPLSRALCSSCA